MRPLNPDEAELWAKVTGSIRPLSREKVESKAAVKEEKVPQKPLTPAVPRPAAPKPPTTARPKPGTTLDSTWDRRLRTGDVEPDRIVDLHGMSLDSAWRAIDRALEQAINHGDRVVLLITGHPRRGATPVKRGKIRAAVHDWLAASRHASRIAAVRGASRRHGGGGCLYLILRRR